MTVNRMAGPVWGMYYMLSSSSSSTHALHPSEGGRFQPVDPFRLSPFPIQDMPNSCYAHAQCADKGHQKLLKSFERMFETWDYRHASEVLMAAADVVQDFHFRWLEDFHIRVLQPALVDMAETACADCDSIADRNASTASADTFDLFEDVDVTKSERYDKCMLCAKHSRKDQCAVFSRCMGKYPTYSQRLDTGDLVQFADAFGMCIPSVLISFWITFLYLDGGILNNSDNALSTSKMIVQLLDDFDNYCGKEKYRDYLFHTVRFSPIQLRYVVNHILVGHQVDTYGYHPANMSEEERKEPSFDHTGFMIFDIFDLGANRGADTLHYLRKGYSVLGVEADPRSQEVLLKSYGASVDISRYMLAGLLLVGTDFYGDTGKFCQGWMSEQSFVIDHRVHTDHYLKQACASFVEMPAVSCRDLLINMRIPYVYFKIDIEGQDENCINALWNLTQPDSPHGPVLKINISLAVRVPQYLSVEFKPWNEEFGKAANEIYEMVSKLSAVGYKRFKFTLQNFYDSYYAPLGSGSGPFGDDAVDIEFGHQWRTKDQVYSLAKYFTQPRWNVTAKINMVWVDLHAAL